MGRSWRILKGFCVLVLGGGGDRNVLCNFSVTRHISIEVFDIMTFCIGYYFTSEVALVEVHCERVHVPVHQLSSRSEESKETIINIIREF